MGPSLDTRIRINRAELSGAFGDIGTDLPLLAGMLLVSGMHPASVLTAFGLAQVASAFFYGIPMPVQPLKAVAALVIAGGIVAPQIYGAGLSIGILMLLLTASGLLDRLRATIPKAVIRGIQMGLGIKLCLLAITRYIPSDGDAGLILAAVCGATILLLLNSRRCPPAIPVIGIGLVYAFCFSPTRMTWQHSFGFSLPRMPGFSVADVLQGAILLALPQIPLSLGNSLFATHQMANDLFPERRVQLRTIGYTYSVLNVLMPLVGGVPVCHGSGGMAGHHLFGGRTGGSVLIYGILLMVFGLFFGAGFDRVVHAFPLPVLGVMLLAESMALMRFARDVLTDRLGITVVGLTALCSVLLPCGFLIGMVAGTLVAYAPRMRHRATAVLARSLTAEGADV